MKFAILSDSHDNLASFQKAIDFLNREQIAVMLHCGDICTRETMAAAEKRFAGEMLFVRGNGDYGLDDIPERREAELGGRRVAWVHYPDVARRLAESGKYDTVFYGHTHKPWEEKIGACRLVNPGEISGQRFRPTFAIYDAEADMLQLKRIDEL